jgi:cytochrome c oxidase cbb3-type subunit 3
VRSARRLLRRLPVLALPLAAAAAGLLACDAGGRTPGERLFRANCAKCHGVDGAGNTPGYMGKQYADLTDDYWKNGGNPEAIERTIRGGIFGEMPSFSSQLKDAEVKELVKYVLSLHRGGT